MLEAEAESVGNLVLLVSYKLPLLTNNLTGSVEQSVRPRR